VRGRVDLMINGSYWVGAAAGSGATVVLLNPNYLPVWLGWRLAFGIGAILGLIVIFFRRWIPESPRWLLIHGRPAEAEQILDEVEHSICAERARERSSGVMEYWGEEKNPITPTLHYPTPPAEPPTRVRTRTHTPWREIWNTI